MKQDGKRCQIGGFELKPLWIECNFLDRCHECVQGHRLGLFEHSLGCCRWNRNGRAIAATATATGRCLLRLTSRRAGNRFGFKHDRRRARNLIVREQNSTSSFAALR